MLLGPELVTNGDFAADTDWDKDVGAEWAIAAGDAAIAVATGTLSLSQGIGMVLGRSYRVGYKISGIAGTASLLIGNGGVSKVLVDGTFSETYTATGATPGTLYFQAETGASVTVDDVSVKEVLSSKFFVQGHGGRIEDYFKQSG
jgi:hypothetical protein